MDKELFKRKIEANCICWYDFKQNSKILIVGENIQELKEILICRNCIVETTEDISVVSNDKFDYIIIKEKLKILSEAKKMLNEKGIILFLVNNKNGLANILNNKEKYSKQEIERCLKKLNFSTYKFFYPLSNYKQANAIFSDDSLPEYNNSKLINNVFYEEKDIIKYNEIEAIKLVTKAGKFVEYTNSYIVEINNKSDINFVSFNNSRNEEYRLVTKVYKDKVVKEPANEKAGIHIAQIKENIELLKDMGFNILDTYQDGNIISKFVVGKTLYEEIIDLIYCKKTEAAISVLKKWYEYIKNKCSNLNETYIDLVLENTFYRDGEYLFFDQEWKLENATSDFILYRAVNNLYIYNPEISEIITKEEFWARFNINSEKIEEFNKYEKEFQDKVVNKELVAAYDIEYREKYKNIKPFEFYIKEPFLKKILNKLR